MWDTEAAGAEVAADEGGDEIAEWQPQLEEPHAEAHLQVAATAEVGWDSPQVINVNVTFGGEVALKGDIGVRLSNEAWADAEEFWEDSAVAGAYALAAASGDQRAVSSEEDEEETAAAVVVEEDESSENGLNAIGAASAESTPKVGSADEAEGEDEEEDNYAESSGS